MPWHASSTTGLFEHTPAATIADCRSVGSVVRDIDPQNDLTFFRVRGKNKQEIMVAPDKNLFLIVIQDQVLEQD